MAPSRSRPGPVSIFVVTLVAQVFTGDATGTTVVTGISPTSITVNTATTITLTGSAASGDKLDFLVTCGAAPTTLLSDSTPDVTVASVANGLKLCYRASGQSDSIEQNGIVLNVIAATPNNKITQISPESMYSSVASQILLYGIASSGDKASFGQACASTVPSTAVTVGTNQQTAFTVGSTGANFRLCYRNAGGSDSVAQDNVFLSVSAAGGVGADPVTWYGDQVRVFSLPVGKLMPMMSGTDMTLHGQTFAYGGPWQQWFDRMVLASPEGDRWVQIKVRKDILEFNRSRHYPRGNFETLEVTLGHGSFDNPTMSTVVHSPDIHIPLNFLGFDVVFWKMARNARAANTMIGSAHRECMEVAGANVHFYICSSPAHEFYGWQRDLAVKYAHLDLAIIEVKNGEHLTGTLPELWGMQTMSETTEAFIVHGADAKPPTYKSASSTVPLPEESAKSKDILMGLSLPALPKGSLPAGKGWAGGLGFKDLENSCKDSNETVLACKAKTVESTARPRTQETPVMAV